MADVVKEREYVSLHFDEKKRYGYIAWKDQDGNVLRIARIHADRIGKMSKGWKFEQYVDELPSIAEGSVVIEYKVKTTKVRV